MINLDEWKFSLEIAWDDSWFRWQAVATLVVSFIGSIYFLWKVVPAGMKTGLLVLHYNLYFGIDEVLPWYWAFALPPILFCLLAIDLLAAGNFFRKERIMSRVLLCIGTLFAALMLIGGHYLILANV